MFEAIITGYRFLYLQLASLVGYGWAIVALSFICSFLMLPLMRAVAGIVRREKEYEDVIDPQVAAIKAKYESDMDRHFHIQALYQRYGYSPLAPIKKVMPLFVQIPFLLLTYYMLKGTVQLSDVSFFFLRDLGQPDALIAGVNLLPIVMTGVNILTVFATPGFSHKDWTQAIAISLLFLVLLYTAPSALLLYWTLNNTITFVRTLCEKHFAGAHLLFERMLSLPMTIAGLVKPGKGVSLSVVTLRALRNFVVLLAFAIVPIGWVLLSWVPDRLSVDVKASESGSIVLMANGRDVASMELRPSHEFETMIMYLPDGCKYEDLSMRLTGQVSGVAFGRVVLRKGWLLDCVRNVPAVEPIDGRENHYAINSSGFDAYAFMHPILWTLVIAGIVIVALVSWVCAVHESHKTRMHCIVPVIYVSSLSSFVLLVVMPLQSFLINRQLLDLQLTPLLLQMGLRFLVGSILAGICLFALAKCFGRYMVTLLFALTVCVFLESGLLSIGLPTLTGNMDYFENANRAILDSGVWLLVFGVALFGRRFILSHIGFLCLIVAAWTAESLLEVKVDEPVDSSYRIVNRFLRPKDVINSVRYSSQGNVLLIVLDSLTREEASAAMDDEVDGAELKKHFSGFVAYTNNVGMHEFTAPSVAGILTGEYFENPNRNAEYYSSIFSRKSVLKDFLDANWSVYMVPGSFTYAYTNRPVTDSQDDVDWQIPPMKKRVADLQAWNLEELVKFRSAPFVLKRPFYDIAMRNWPMGGSIRFETVMFPSLASQPVASEKGVGRTFIYTHTEGIHIPIMYDRNGHLLPERLDNFKGGKEQAIFILRELGKLMDSYRDKGIYDNSMIIVSADHGDWYSQFPEKKSVLPSLARPMLWIKPVNSSGPFVVSSIPTSQSKIASVMRASIAENMSRKQIEEGLIARVRRFRADGAGVWLDWDIDESNNVSYAEHEQHVELRPLETGKAYSWHRSKLGMSPDVQFENVIMSWDGPLFGDGTKMAFKFKVPITTHTYTLTLKFNIVAGDRYGVAHHGIGGELFYQEDNPTSKVMAPNKRRVKVEVPNLKPDKEGVIILWCEKIGHFDAIGFTDLEIVQDE